DMGADGAAAGCKAGTEAAGAEETAAEEAGIAGCLGECGGEAGGGVTGGNAGFLRKKKISMVNAPNATREIRPVRGVKSGRMRLNWDETKEVILLIISNKPALN
ncbi:MAG TPA: hypothetical protein VMR37_01050, partial [Rhabdochlamydiaceae bacterium]|nr:hypothetical protein [Rhabdochlamydiaceae bacterium]